MADRFVVAMPSRHDAAATDQLVITSSRGADAIVISLRAELDLASSASLERELRAAELGGPGRLSIDLGGLEFIDSTGLHVLLLAQQRARASGRRLSLRHGPPAIQRVFELTNTIRVFSFED